jgi:hypothetical protein
VHAFSLPLRSLIVVLCGVACRPSSGAAVRCLEDEESVVLTDHLAALVTVRDLLVRQATADRAVGLAVLPSVGILGVVAIDAPCEAREAVCSGPACWVARCTPEGWETTLSGPVSLPESATLETAQFLWDSASGRIGWTARGDGLGVWTVAQRGVLAKGALAVAEGFPLLREGHEVVLRVSLPGGSPGVGSIAADGLTIAEIAGGAIRPAGRCLQR